MNTHQEIKNLSGFRWWINHQRLRYLRLFFWILSALIIVIAAIWIAGFDTFTFSEQVFGIGSIIIFALVGVGEIILFFKTFFWKVEKYWTGIVIDMRRELLPNRNVKYYHITAKVGEKEVEGICLAKTYFLAEKGQPILLFSIGNEKIYCVHADMK